MVIYARPSILYLLIQNKGFLPQGGFLPHVTLYTLTIQYTIETFLFTFTRRTMMLTIHDVVLFFPGAPSIDLSTMSLTKHYCLHVFCLADIAAAERFVSSGRRAQRAKRRSSPCWRRAVGRSTNTRRRRRTGRRGEETTNTSSLDSSPTARKRSTSNSHATPRYRLEASLSFYWKL